jgi:predicted  nucleic acid-binding Zn-ribbon protein
MSEKLNKIEDQELKKVVDQQKKLNAILTDIGVLETKKHGLLHKIAELNKDMEDLKSDLEGKYGAININLEDGTYTEIEKEK